MTPDLIQFTISLINLENRELKPCFEPLNHTEGTKSGLKSNYTLDTFELNSYYMKPEPDSPSQKNLSINPETTQGSSLSMSGKLLHLDASDNPDEVMPFFKALASETRLAILVFLGNRIVNVNEIAGALNISPSSATSHIQILEKAGLIRTEVAPASHGLQKLCARTFDQLLIQLPRIHHHTHKNFTVSMPVGSYWDFDVRPTCGIATEDQLIGIMDDPASFYEPEHVQAQLLWFREGYVTYRFPNHLPANATPQNLELSMEICSEAPLHHLDWPSDITLWVNGVEVGTWTSPGDFGGQRGLLTPGWWEEKDTQFGLLKVWRVSDDGAFIDGKQISHRHIKGLNLGDQRYIEVRIGIKPDAHNIGGINLFGEKFGNYPQAIILKVDYILDPALGNGAERRL